jgi:hypothetical protein
MGQWTAIVMVNLEMPTMLIQKSLHSIRQRADGEDSREVLKNS